MKATTHIHHAITQTSDIEGWYQSMKPVRSRIRAAHEPTLE